MNFQFKGTKFILYIYIIIMKKILLLSLLLVATLWLASCGSDVPLTEDEQAEQYNMSVGKYKETKDAAARMNMTIEDHMKMTDTEHEDMWSMDMWDDSSMIEDDMNMKSDDMMMGDEEMHMETMHEWEDTEKHGSNEHE